MTVTCHVPGVDLIAADPQRAVLAVDFDGTLAPIVDDPECAHANETSIHALAQIAPLIGGVAIITGRPVAQVLQLGGCPDHARSEHLVIYGHRATYSCSARTGAIAVTPPPPALARVRACLPDRLPEHEAADAFIADKGQASAV